jgi:hypothetical protein
MPASVEDLPKAAVADGAEDVAAEDVAEDVAEAAAAAVTAGVAADVVEAVAEVVAEAAVEDVVAVGTVSTVDKAAAGSFAAVATVEVFLPVVVRQASPHTGHCRI